MCYTSGTTGLPKGVVYSHRSSVLHALGVAANNPFGLGTSVNDAILPVVPMFHANAWGYPYVATMVGAKLVYPGQHLDAVSLLEDFTQEGVTWSAGVPTIWLGILAELEADPGKWDLSRTEGHVRRRLGGAAEAHRRLRTARAHDRAGLGHDGDVAGRLDGRDAARPERARRRVQVRPEGDGRAAAAVRRGARAGRTTRRSRGTATTMGELEVRGPWVAIVLLRRAGIRRPLDQRRLVPHGRHRLDPSRTATSRSRTARRT